jgi:peptidoglycan-N-acetylglucosamine deacetylase
MKISILIPCWNEEKSVRSCVESCLNQSRKFDQILVVNDGSTDNTLKILKSFGKKITVISYKNASGSKSFAQERGFEYITGDIMVTTDADTILDKDFVNNIIRDFKDPQVAAVAGYVRSLKRNWITLCRAFDYVIGQNIYKLAQNYLGYIFVIPGASCAFRTEPFRKYVGFDHDTITEDLDFTYKLHKNNQKIKYNDKAIVYTQDPDTLTSYIGQMRRWYGGGWQNLIKHFNEDLIDDPRRVIELSLIYIEGVVFSVLLFIVPIINIILALKIFFMLTLIVAIEAVYAAIREKRMELLLVPFIYPVMMYINSWVSLEEFVHEGLKRDHQMTWFHPERRSI